MTDPVLRDHIVALEQRLLDPAVRKNASLLAALIADDFIELTGMGTVCGKQDVLDALQREVAQPRLLSDAQVTRLAEDVIFVRYRLERRAAGAATAQHSRRSSIWRRDQGEWRIWFHQGTPCEADDRA